MNILFTLLFFLSLSCSGGIIEPETKWKKLNVTICFAESTGDWQNQVQKERIEGMKFIPLSQEEKETVIRTIETEFSKERTSITFSGWKDCADTPSPDAIVSKAKITKFLGIEVAGPTFRGESSIGNDGDDLKAYQGTTGKRPLIILMDYTPVIIAHEFGHLAGLRHEHIHPQASHDQRCLRLFKLSPKSYGSYFEKIGDKFYGSTKVVTKYDPDSIMNDCAIQRLRTPRTELLSELDQKTLKEEYKLGEDSPN